MSHKIKPLPPIKIKINLFNTLKLFFLLIVSFILWIALIFAGINLLSYYVFSIKSNGFFHEETLKYAIYVVIGAYFCLILDKAKIYEALNVKRDLPFITIEKIKQEK